MNFYNEERNDHYLQVSNLQILFFYFSIFLNYLELYLIMCTVFRFSLLKSYSIFEYRQKKKKKKKKSTGRRAVPDS
jgi:hypothetical protein